MSTKPPAGQRPAEEVKDAGRFYSELGLESDYFSALWHSFNVGHMISTDLDRICRDFGLSLADFNLMGALRIDRPVPMRATDLAVTLQVSNAALTTRIDRLINKGMVLKFQRPGDRRAFHLQLTDEGGGIVDSIHKMIEKRSNFVRHFRQLSQDDRASLERIMAELHGQLDRDFTNVHR